MISDKVDEQRDVGEDAEQAVATIMNATTRMPPITVAISPACDGILAEARADRALLDDGQVAGSAPARSSTARSLALCGREIAGNLAGAAEDRLADLRRGDHLVVEDDRKQAADILLGRLAETLCALAVEAEG